MDGGEGGADNAANMLTLFTSSRQFLSLHIFKPLHLGKVHCSFILTKAISIINDNASIAHV